MGFDINANSLDRIRRNFQAIAKGAVTPFIKLLAPLMYQSSTGAIGMNVETSTGLTVDGNGALALLFADASIVGSSTGIKVQKSSTGAISTGPTGIGVELADNSLVESAAGLAVNLDPSHAIALISGGNGIGVQVDGSTVAIGPGNLLEVNFDSNTLFVNGNPNLAVLLESSGGLTSATGGNGIGIQLAGSTSGLSLSSSGLSVGTLTSTNLPGDVAYTDKTNTFTANQTITRTGLVGTNIPLAVTATSSTSGVTLTNLECAQFNVNLLAGIGVSGNVQAFTGAVSLRNSSTNTVPMAQAMNFQVNVQGSGSTTTINGANLAVAPTADNGGGASTVAGLTASVDQSGGGLYTTVNFATVMGLNIPALVGSTNAYGVYIPSTAIAATTGDNFGLYIGSGAKNYLAGSTGIGTVAPKATLHGTGTTILGAANSALSSTVLGNSQVNIWVDEANNALKFQVRYSSGIVKNGSTALI